MIVSEMLAVVSITNAALLPRAGRDALVLHDGFALGRFGAASVGPRCRW